jgi:hypothetical protein
MHDVGEVGWGGDESGEVDSFEVHGATCPVRAVLFALSTLCSREPLLPLLLINGQV